MPQEHPATKPGRKFPLLFCNLDYGPRLHLNLLTPFSLFFSSFFLPLSLHLPPSIPSILYHLHSHSSPPKTPTHIHTSTHNGRTYVRTKGRLLDGLYLHQGR